jgi:hypothetical protein
MVARRLPRAAEEQDVAVGVGDLKAAQAVVCVLEGLFVALHSGPRLDTFERALSRPLSP